MYKRYSCAAGHSWDVPLDGQFDVAGVACPHCGAPAETAGFSEGRLESERLEPGEHHPLPPRGHPLPAETSSERSASGLDHFDAPPSPLPAARETGPRLDDASGQCIGPYRLLQKIGEGGMGSVYMAEQQLPVRRRVALKIIKAGMDSEQVIARFESERQALALMDHQNISRVLDAGATEAGRPYFVMELIKGVPITKYCDDNRLSLLERLELFVPVCLAIQHAHQKGIIHRDIKPSNVLVTMYDGRPVPKIIDFGVAKATEQRLTERTMFTRFGQVIGTLEYMSPEQAEMNALDIDTRSDVYALGVVLYELLTGSTPLQEQRLRGAALQELLRMIREDEPPPPSTKLRRSSEQLATVSAQRRTNPLRLARLLHGELDWIVMKALEKDRNRRYDTASAFARDLQRYLSDEPVEACPPSALYRLRKFAGKHRRGLALALAFALTLLGGTLVSTYFGLRAVGEADKARRAAHEAQLKSREAQAATVTAQQQREQSRRHLYAAHLHMIQEAWERPQGIGLVRELLQRQLPAAGEKDLRGFEWHYWNRMAYSHQLELAGHAAEVLTVAFAAEGKWLASAGSDGAVKLWDAHQGVCLSTWNHVAEEGEMLAFSPGGERMIAASRKGPVTVRDAATGSVWLTLTVPGPILRAVFSRDGRRLATLGEDEVLRVWDAAEGREIVAISRVRGGCAFSPDGRYIASGSEDALVRIWDAETGAVAFVLEGHGDEISSVAFSPLGEFLASAGGNEVMVWDAATGDKRETLRGHAGQVTCMAFNPAYGSLATAGEDGDIQLWDTLSWRRTRALKGHLAGVTALAFSPDGERLASSSHDRTVKVWSAAELPGGGTILPLGSALSPDGERRVDRTLYPTIKTWNTRDGQQLSALEGVQGQFSPGGEWLTVLAEAHSGGQQAISILDTGSGKVRQTLAGHHGSVSALSFRADGGQLATSGDDLTIRLWDIPSGTENLAVPVTEGAAVCLAVSPDGKRLAFVGGGLAWPTTELPGRAGRSLRPTLQRRDMALTLSGRKPDAGMAIEIWDIASRRQLHVLQGHRAFVFQLAFSPDGTRLASAGFDHTVKMWDPVEGREVWTGEGHTAPVSRIAFSGDGRFVTTAGQDDSVRVWNAASGQQVRSWQEEKLFRHVQLSSDGRWLMATTSGPDTASGEEQPVHSLWDLEGSQKISAWTGNPRYQHMLWLSLDGNRLATLEGEPVLKVVSVTGDQATRPHTFRHPGGTSVWASFSPDGMLLASSGTDQTLRVWNVLSGQRVFSSTVPPVAADDDFGQPFKLAFSASGKQLVMREPSAEGLGRLAIWDFESGARRDTSWRCESAGQGIALSADGTLVALGGDDGTVTVRETESGRHRLTLKGHGASIRCVAFSPDGTRLASAGNDATLRIWDAVTGEPLLTLPCSSVQGLAFNAAGNRLSAADLITTVTWEGTPR